jgi:septation ring formation regulator EzrA
MLEGTLATLSGPTLIQVKALLEVYKEKSRIERSLEALQQSRNTLSNEQARVRTNLVTTVQANQKEMQQKYTAQLQSLEQRLVGLLEEEDRLKASHAELEKKADHLIDTWPSPNSIGRE